MRNYALFSEFSEKSAHSNFVCVALFACAQMSVRDFDCGRDFALQADNEAVPCQGHPKAKRLFSEEMDFDKSFSFFNLSRLKAK